MKTIVFAILALVMPLVIFAQEPIKTDDQPQTLFGNEKIAISGFGAPIYEFSAMKNSLSVCSGGGGAFIFNQMVFFGAYGMSLSNKFEKNYYSSYTLSDRDYNLQFTHGGFWLGYIHNSKSVLHWGVSTKIGWGQVSYVDNLSNRRMYDWDEKYRNEIFVLSPQLEGEVNLWRWFKVNVGVGYRYVGGISKKDDQGNDVYSKTQFNSPVASLTFLFGPFGKKKPKVPADKK